MVKTTGSHSLTIRALLALALVLGCTADRTRTTLDWGAEPAIVDRLVFGRAIPSGGIVSDDDWTRFLAETVTPRFPEGLTVWHAEGQWTDPGGRLIREPVLILEIVHPAEAAADSSLVAIAQEYRRRFRQDAVLRITTEASVRLIE